MSFSLSFFDNLTRIELCFLVLGLGVSVKALQAFFSRNKTTNVRGPVSWNWIFGLDGKADRYEAWAAEYGAVYSVPGMLGSSTLVLCDPKAIAHFYAKETWEYQKAPTQRLQNVSVLEVILGDYLLHASDRSRHPVGGG